MVDERSMKEFQDTGLLWFINTILHAFGWAIVLELVGGVPVNMYPARVMFRGFNGEINDEGYLKLSKYLKDNAEKLHKEILH